MPPHSFSSLPQGIHLQAGKLLKPSEMKGMILASKHMRERYAKSYFYDVAFRGTSMDLVLDLIAFIHAKNHQPIKVVCSLFGACSRSFFFSQ
jgi:hypothetical protein